MALWIPRPGKAVDLSTEEKRKQSVQAVWRGFYARWEGPAAEVIQKWWRGHAARRFVAALREGRLLKHGVRERVEETAAVVIQRYWRGFQARRQAAERLKAVVDIQRWWKGYRARKEWPRLRLRWRARNHYATDIQRWVRGHLARRRVKQLREQRREHAAAAAGRSSAAASAATAERQVADGVSHATMSDETRRLREAAATRIQACWRGYQARKRRAWLRRQAAKRRRYEQRLAAVKLVQAFYRGWYVRRAIARLRARGPLAPGSLAGGAVAAPGIAGDTSGAVVLPYGDYDSDGEDAQQYQRPVPHGHPRPPPLPHMPSRSVAMAGRGAGSSGGVGIGRRGGVGIGNSGGRQVGRAELAAPTLRSTTSTAAAARAQSSPSRAAPVQPPAPHRTALSQAASAVGRTRAGGTAAGSALASVRAAHAAAANADAAANSKGGPGAGTGGPSSGGGGFGSAALSDPGVVAAPQPPSTSSRRREAGDLRSPLPRPGTVPEPGTRKDPATLDPADGQHRPAPEPLGNLSRRCRTHPSGSDAATTTVSSPGPPREGGGAAAAAAPMAASALGVAPHARRPSQLLPTASRQRSQPGPTSPSLSPATPPLAANPGALRALRQSVSVPSALIRTSTTVAQGAGRTATAHCSSTSASGRATGQQPPSPPPPDTPPSATGTRSPGAMPYTQPIAAKGDCRPTRALGFKPPASPAQLASSVSASILETTGSGGAAPAASLSDRQRPASASESIPGGGYHPGATAPSPIGTSNGAGSHGNSGGGGPLVPPTSSTFKCQPEPLRSPSCTGPRTSRSQGLITGSRPQPLSLPAKPSTPRRLASMRRSAPEPIRVGSAPAGGAPVGGGGGGGCSREPEAPALSAVPEVALGPRRQAWAEAAPGAASEGASGGAVDGAHAPQTPRVKAVAAAAAAASAAVASASAVTTSDAAGNPLHDQVMRANRGGKVVNEGMARVGKLVVAGPAAVGGRRKAR